MNLQNINKIPLFIYNTISKNKEIFKPLKKNYLKMYVCGPTIYKKIHIGNCRTFIFFDLVYRYFNYLKYKIKYVRNITDIGYYISNNKLFFSENVKNILYFKKIMKNLNILSPNIEPIASNHISEQIKLIKLLLNKNIAYLNNKSIYFNINKYVSYNKYGILSNNSINNLYNVKNISNKINNTDFALWKNKKKGLYYWKTELGIGYPGWHIECVAMSKKYLGNYFDIHGGGIDLQFPHHESEIMISNILYNNNISKYWIHVNVLTNNNIKMSKSKNNDIIIDDIIKKNSKITYNIVRFFLIKYHYRSVIKYNINNILFAVKEYKKLLFSFNILKYKINYSKYSNFDIKKWIINCIISLNNDFNTPILIRHLFTGVKYINLMLINKYKLNKHDLKLFTKYMYDFLFNILGINV